MFLKFILRNALRHRLRTALTALGIFVAILAFGLLSTVIDAWYSGANTASSSRLVTRSAVSLVPVRAKSTPSNRLPSAA